MHKSLKAHFLIAAPHMKDPNFESSIVLILEHTHETAMGLVINHPSNLSVNIALAKHFELPQIPDKIYVGGPVEPSALCILHNFENLTVEDAPIVPGVLIGSCPDAFEEVISKAASQPVDSSNGAFRVFSGYSGWGAMQLEHEIERGDWFVHPASCEIVFSIEPHESWSKLIDIISSKYRYWPQLTDKQAESN
jgi:putative transcriptional regulator